MSKKCIVVSSDGKYLTPRRNTGEMYVSRSGWSDDIDDAKIFQTPGAASNSASYNNEKKYTIKHITISVVASLD